jgi:small subunit ribosomal protein S5
MLMRQRETRERDISTNIEAWKPKTELGRKVKDREITNIDEVLDAGKAILEPEIVDALIKLEADLLLIGQAKGKFGGGQRRTFRQTQKKTMEGNKPKFTAMAVVGDHNGHVGIGLGSAKETLPAREKAIRKAKLNLFKIRRGTGSWQDASSEPHSIPFAVEGKTGSVLVKLLPAPKGKGLVVEKEAAKVLNLAGIRNVWSKTYGQTKNKVNFIKALEFALRQLTTTKTQPQHYARLSILDGASAQAEIVETETKPAPERRPVTRQRRQPMKGNMKGGKRK